LELVWNFHKLIINILNQKMETNVELVWEMLGEGLGRRWRLWGGVEWII
jgi:hypothetical protein